MLFYYDIMMFGYEKLASLPDYSCVISVLYANQREDVSHTVVTNTIPCPRMARAVY